MVIYKLPRGYITAGHQRGEHALALSPQPSHCTSASVLKYAVTSTLPDCRPGELLKLPKYTTVDTCLYGSLRT